MRFCIATRRPWIWLPDVATPVIFRFQLYKDNLGEWVRNEGSESLKTTSWTRGDLLVSCTLNIAHNKNEILKISESVAAYNDKVNSIIRRKVGRGD